MTATTCPARPDAATTSPGRRKRADHDLLSVTGGLAALSLDAMASVAYGPEAIVLVLAAAGSAGLGFTLPVTLASVGLLAVLILSYRQVIAAFPNGGGAYAVPRPASGGAPAWSAGPPRRSSSSASRWCPKDAGCSPS